jgi:hypothetical protein
MNRKDRENSCGEKRRGRRERREFSVPYVT